jgi:hypothetical protein
VGYWLPRLLSIPKRQAIAIGMEIGIHNGTLAIALALSPSLLNNATMAVPAAMYSLIMFFTAGAFGWWVSRGRGWSSCRAEGGGCRQSWRPQRALRTSGALPPRWLLLQHPQRRRIEEPERHTALAPFTAWCN